MPGSVSGKSLNVLLATAYFDSHRGGIEIVAGRLARELRQRGVDVTWLATDATSPPTPKEMGAGGGQVLAVAAWNIAERRLGFPLPLPGPGGVAAIWRAVKSTDAVLLHDSLYPTNIVAMVAARWHRRPVVLVQHIAAVPYSNPVLRLVMRAANAVIARPMLAAADQVVFISDTVVQHFASVRFKVPPRLIFNGVDTDVFQLPAASFDRRTARASLGLPADGKIVSFVGRFVEKKGLHIIERLARTRPDLTFALAGWGPMDPRAWGLPNVHVFSGLQGASLAPFYQASDVFVLPSIGEGLPLVLQEALACGVPVICGDETASADPAAHGLIDGVAIDSADPDCTAAAFATRITAVLDRNSEVEAAKRHAYVQSRYSWTEAAKSYAAIMSDLVGAKSRS
jgi:glycosyltransferase involved in cell wall biosynthesis